MEQLQSTGKCLFCNDLFSNAGITRHLATHLSQKNKEGTTGISFHVKIESDFNGSPYFLNLWVDGDALMEDIDSFLRAIWLECCGHMSSFSNPKVKRLWSMDFENDENDEDEFMEQSAKEALSKGLKLKYDYDFGSTTQLRLTVQEQYNIKAPEPIVLLSRNEPLAIMCDICHTEPATTICTACWEDNTFCKKCAKKHAKTCEDYADYAAIPLVNSPRTGVCAYDGGIIDKGRDGTFVKK